MSSAFTSHRDRIDRIRARAWGLQILYRWEAMEAGASVRDALVETTATRRISPRRLPYLRQLLSTAGEHMDEVDEWLRQSLDNWRLDRLAAVDRAVLRLAATEMVFLEEIPPRVSIQEAVRLAEQYGGPDSPRFVNGVLDALYRRLAPVGEP